jgi:hypothetical protein
VNTESGEIRKQKVFTDRVTSPSSDLGVVEELDS